ncbi:hypothetical protein RG2014_040 [Delftia phage RG-2014]|uniref:Uncharacterized protein n=1 Tax=Delftia phage RG-2014 TaxID=1563661 RepID=A0A097PAL9_9CAUD|nr:hypothetical protein RG2014_040 [Delftia phage RG-2014]AIU44294.1 hypothetical protein RG2014_040 [Delftia phage RG-2014]
MDLTHDDILSATMKLDTNQKVQDFAELEKRLVAFMMASKANGKAYDFVVWKSPTECVGYSIQNGEMHAVTMSEHEVKGKNHRLLIVDDLVHESIVTMQRGQSKNRMLTDLLAQAAIAMSSQIDPPKKGKTLPWFHGKRRF